ncbi:hypothetical protein ACFY8X_29720 [Streptomyces tanashiensis]|uniref:hypothetical protein n=1 Tax=Streptomyces tanashiensis TaxID=67367 RepID=UPI0036E2081F
MTSRHHHFNQGISMRKLAAAAVAAGLFFGGMGAAAADPWGRELNMSTTGAVFRGWYKWEPRLQNRGAFHVRGRLSDGDPGDGHNVYLRAKVEGYGWVRVKGTQRKTVDIDELFYDGAVLETNHAEIQLCRDRGSLRPDNCSDLRKFRR